MGAIDLSELKSKSDVPSLDGLSEEEKQKIREMAEQNPPDDAESVKTAFLVLLHHDGTAEVSPDLTKKVSREDIPNTPLVFQAVSTIAKDIQVQETAQVTTMFMQQAAMALQHQMQNQQIAQGLHL